MLNTQNAILSSFLFANNIGENIEDAFILDETVFNTPLTNRIAHKINEETLNDKMYGFQLVSIEDDLKGTKFETEFIDILSQLPLPLTVAQRLHDKLIKKCKQRIAIGLPC